MHKLGYLFLCTLLQSGRAACCGLFCRVCCCDLRCIFALCASACPLCVFSASLVVETGAGIICGLRQFCASGGLPCFLCTAWQACPAFTAARCAAACLPCLPAWQRWPLSLPAVVCCALWPLLWPARPAVCASSLLACLRPCCAFCASLRPGCVPAVICPCCGQVWQSVRAGFSSQGGQVLI